MLPAGLKGPDSGRPPGQAMRWNLACPEVTAGAQGPFVGTQPTLHARGPAAPAEAAPRGLGRPPAGVQGGRAPCVVPALVTTRSTRG